MSVIVKKDPLEYPRSTNWPEASISYLVVGDTANPVTDESQAAQETGISPGDQHDVYPILIADRISSTRLTEHNYAWVIEWIYVIPPGLELDGSFEPIPGEIVSFTTNQSGQFIDVWRSNPTLPTGEGGDTVDRPNPSRDIIGIHIDSHGDPVSLLLDTIEYQVTRQLLAVPDFQLIQSMIGKRNDEMFLNIGAGQLVFKSAISDGDVDSTGGNLIGPMKVTWRFVGDRWFHLRQQARRKADGSPDVTSFVDIFTAQHVYWVQPFPETAGFTTLGIFD